MVSLGFFSQLPSANYLLPDGSGCRWGVHRERQPAPSHPMALPNEVGHSYVLEVRGSEQDPDQQELSLVKRTLSPPGGKPSGVTPASPSWAPHCLPSLGIFSPPTLLEHGLQPLILLLFYLLHKHHCKSNNINQRKKSPSVS